MLRNLWKWVYHEDKIRQFTICSATPLYRKSENEINECMDYEGDFFPASYLNEGQFTPNRNEYLPIPQRQIDLSTVGGTPVLQQNIGY